MPSAGGLSPLVPLLVLLVSLSVSGGVSRRLSPWEVAERAELLMEEAAADGLLAPPGPILIEDQFGTDGERQELTQKEFQARCELVGES